MHTETNATETLLVEWGKWSQAGLGLTLNSVSSFDCSFITDDQGLEIDGVIALLGANLPKTQKVIMLYYRSKMSYRTIAKRLEIGETKARQLHQNGVAWIDGHFAAKKEQAFWKQLKNAA